MSVEEQIKESATNMMKAGIEQGFSVDQRAQCAYMTKGSSTIYIDWSMPCTDGLIMDSWDN